MASDQRKSAFAKRLREAREKAGFETADQFAARVGIEAKIYRGFELDTADGPDAWPAMPRLLAICSALNMTPNDLLGFGGAGADSYTTQPNGIDIQNKIDELYHLIVVANQVVNGGIQRANLDTAIHLINLLERSSGELRKCLIQHGPFYAKVGSASASVAPAPAAAPAPGKPRLAH